MRVHLVNPSHVSFGVGVITPRWLYVLAAATPARFGDPHHRRRDARGPRPRRPCSRATSSASASTPATRCAATKSAGWRASAGATVVFGGIHATLYPEEARELGGAHAVVKGDGDVVWAAVARRLSPTGRLQPRLRRRPRRRRAVHAGALGPAARRQLHVGLGADRARLPEALLVLLGLAHRRPAAAAARTSTSWSTRSSSCGARASASSRSPTTTSIRSRSKICAWPSAAPTRPGCTSSRRSAPSASS